MNCISYSTLDYKFNARFTYQYPPWAISLGWLMACSSIIMVPIMIIWKVGANLIHYKKPWIELIRPKLLPHQMRPGDDPRDINPKATMANTFLPSDILKDYRGSFENYTGDSGFSSSQTVTSSYPVSSSSVNIKT